MRHIYHINFFKKTALNTLATSPLAIAGGEAGAFRSSVFEINKSSSIVNFITHVWSCCSDLLFADWAFGPEGRQQVLKLLVRVTIPFVVFSSKFFGLLRAAKNITRIWRPNTFQWLTSIHVLKWGVKSDPTK